MSPGTFMYIYSSDSLIRCNSNLYIEITKESPKVYVHRHYLENIYLYESHRTFYASHESIFCKVAK
jgi:hypothetical protein